MPKAVDLNELLTLDDLVAQAPSLAAFRMVPQFRNFTIEQIVFGMDIQASAGPMRPPRHIYWRHVKHELYLYFCTDDEKYRSVRLQFSAEGEKIRTTAAGMLAGAIGGQLGIAAGLISPLVALVLIAMLSIGTNAFCEKYNIDRLKPFEDEDGKEGD